MFKLLNVTRKHAVNIRNIPQQIKQLVQYRTFLSQAYYCNEVWEQRFDDSVLQKVNLDELYNELEQKYQKTRNMSAVDVDVFVNAVKEETYTDELLDLVHKLRLSADTCNTLSSTPHATVRNLLTFKKTELLLNALDDRLNYGLFLDDYMANLLLDTFWKNRDYLSGARVAGQLMLQEDFEHPLCASLSLLHCYNYLINPTEWPQPPKPEEPEDEVKIRIKYLRNPYDDYHFDLKDPLTIVGKTLIMITKKLNTSLEKSFHLLGLVLFKQDDAKVFIKKLVKNNEKVYEGILKLIPQENEVQEELKVLQTEPADLQSLLEEHVKQAVDSTVEKDIAAQCENYLKWGQKRKEALDKQHRRLLTIKRLGNIEQHKQDLEDKEMLLWFFENEEKIELEIEEKKAIQAEKEQKKQTVVKTDETYVPPEVQKKYA